MTESNLPKKIRLTRPRIEGFSAPKSGRAVVYDDRVPGFGVRITAKGTKTFILYRKILGKPQLFTIGKYPTVPVDIARSEAERLNGEIARGINPMDDRNAARREKTFGDFFEEYLTKHARPHKRTAESDERRYNLYLQGWRNKRLTSITRKEIQALHGKVGREKGPYAANRLLSLLSMLFNLAKDWGYFEGENPASRIRRFHEEKRERFIELEDLPALAKAIDDEPNQDVSDYVWLSLMTGARKGNMLTMKWEDIDLEKQIWYIPSGNNKNKAPQPVFLHEDVIEILTRRLETRTNEYVLPGSGKEGHLADPKKGWHRILKRAGLKDIRIHDLRRTLASTMLASGADIASIGNILGHKNFSTTMIYARTGQQTSAQQHIKAVTLMREAAKKKPDNVIDLEERKKGEGVGI